MKNQCDGCRRGLPLKDGIHRGGGFDMIACTAERYHDYTQEELDEFRELVEMAVSQQQMDCIYARLNTPEFVARVGKEKCDQMFEVLKKELEKN